MNFPPTNVELSNVSYGVSMEDLRIARDGTYFPTSGAEGHSWVFAKMDGTLLSTSPGPHGLEMDSLRSELLGILSCLYILY
jgi:hypothetical protein